MIARTTSPQGAFHGSRRQRGLAMVEFAIGAPLLLLLLLGIGEFGRLLSQYNQLLQGSRDAARYVSSHAMNATLGRIPDPLPAEVVATAKNLLVYASPTNIDVNVSTTNPPSPPKYLASVVPGLSTEQVQISLVDSEHIQVSVTYNFRPVVGNVLLPGIFGQGIGLNIPLTATTVMRAL